LIASNATAWHDCQDFLGSSVLESSTTQTPQNVLYQRLKAANFNGLKAYPLVDNVEELMSVSDAALTKAGGLSITESLIKGLPMIFFSNIPGLETANARIISNYGAGFIAEPVGEIKRTVSALKNDRFLYEKTRLNINKIKHIDTLDKLSEFLLALS
jgi:processive 1,2-diacylglycerol beta-glucosyltransferase